MEGKIEGWDRS